MPNTYPIDFERNGKGTLIDALSAAPVATPSEVEDDIERSIIGPVVATKTTIVVAELNLAIDIGGDVLLSPMDGVGMELTLGTCTIHLVGNLCAIGMHVGIGMQARRNVVGMVTYLLHDVDFAIGRP